MGTAEGKRGEDLATAFLEAKGYKIMEKNYRFKKNEVDLVGFEPNKDYETGGQIVFVEVKYRENLRHGTPEEFVDDAKKKRMWLAAEAYLYETKLEGSPARFDVVAISGDLDQPDIKHYKDAFWFFGGNVMN